MEPRYDYVRDHVGEEVQFIEHRDYCDDCGRRLKRGLCPFCDPEDER